MRLRRAVLGGMMLSGVACGLGVVGTGSAPEDADAAVDASFEVRDTAPPGDACAACPGGFVCAAGVCVDEARTHFTLGANPGGNWTWAYKSKPDAATSPYSVSHGEGNQAGLLAWSTTDASLTPSVFFNARDAAVTVFTASVKIAPFELAFHPGPNDENSVVRWTAPANAVYRVTVSLRGLSGENGSPRTTTNVTIVHGDALLAVTDIGGDGGVGADDAGARTLSLGAVSFAAGEVLDVRLDYGGNRNYFSDTTGIDVVITTPP